MPNCRSHFEDLIAKLCVEGDEEAGERHEDYGVDVGEPERMEELTESYLGTVKFALCAGPRADEGPGGGSNAAHFHNTFSY